jgi:hypothetical protein
MKGQFSLPDGDLPKLICELDFLQSIPEFAMELLNNVKRIVIHSRVQSFRDARSYYSPFLIVVSSPE